MSVLQLYEKDNCTLHITYEICEKKKVQTVVFVVSFILFFCLIYVPKVATYYQLLQVKVVGVLELRKYEYRWSAFLACFLQFTQQFSGINAAMYYSGEIFLAAGLTGFVNTLANCGVTLANVVMTFVSTLLVWLTNIED